MTISYGSKTDKYFISIIYIMAATIGGTILIRDQMFCQPYIGLSVYLLLCGLLFGLFPLTKLQKAIIWEKLYRILPVVLFGAFIYWASSLSLPRGQSISHSDYIFHFGEFFILVLGYLLK